MNQDQVKNVLLKLEPQAAPFVLLFTGKASLKVHGLYKPESQEILLHNKNFQSDEELMYTAIHEFAHHLHFTSSEPPNAARSHNSAYWNLFHRLLKRAEEMGVYRNVFETQKDFQDLTAKIKHQFLETNGQLMKDFGQALMKASELCKKHHVHFEDYMDRVLCIPRVTAKTAMTSFSQNLNPRFGYDQLKTLSTVRDLGFRKDLEGKMAEGYSPDMIKQEIRGWRPEQPEARKPESSRELELLEREKGVLKRRIADSENQLKIIEEKISHLKGFPHES